MAISFFRDGQRNHYCVHLLWYCRVLLPGDLGSSLTTRLQVQKLAQVQKHFIGMSGFSLLVIHP